MPSIFSKKPPSTPSILDKQQQQIFKGINKIEKKVHGGMKDTALDRIVSLYLKPKSPMLSDRELRRRADVLYQSCKHVLRTAPLTSNLEARVFISESFYCGDGLAAGWSVKTIKPTSYWTTRQKVEENAFGYKIDWSVKISEAAKRRPVYAGLNYTDHPYGAAAAYGAINLVYKSEIRDRCTFIASDTFDNEFGFTGDDQGTIAESRKGIVTTLRIGNLLATIGKTKLVALCQKADSAYTYTDYPPNYIEAHIHGPVSFQRDLAAIRIASTGTATLAKEAVVAKMSVGTIKYLISEFAERYNVRASIYDKGNEIEVLHAG